MTIYLSGPMSGLPNFGYPIFNAAAARLRSMGHAVFNPAETFGGDSTLRKEQYLIVDYAAVQVCDTVVMLPGWESSEGATTERVIALSLGKTVYGYDDFLDEVTGEDISLIGLVGYAQSGKDEVAKCLVEEYGFRRVAFADPLKAVATSIGWNGRKDEEGRKLLQDLGVAVREHLDPNTWLNRALREIGNAGSSVVVTDCRFLNEIEAIRNRGGQIWRVSRLGHGPANGHVSEREWTTEEPDHFVRNDGTIDDLREKVGELLQLQPTEN